MKSWLQDTDIEMYLTLNEENLLLLRVIRTLKNEIYKYTNSISKNDKMI